MILRQDLEMEFVVIFAPDNLHRVRDIICPIDLDTNLGLFRIYPSMSDESEYPISVDTQGRIKLKTENMTKDKLYHCVADEKVFLFFKDEDEMLNCYEIEDIQVVNAIKERPAEIEDILKKFAL